MPILVHRFLELWEQKESTNKTFDLDEMLWAEPEVFELPVIESRNLQAVMDGNTVCLIDSRGFGDLSKFS